MIFPGFDFKLFQLKDYPLKLYLLVKQKKNDQLISQKNIEKMFKQMGQDNGTRKSKTKIWDQKKNWISMHVFKDQTGVPNVAPPENMLN